MSIIAWKTAWDEYSQKTIYQRVSRSCACPEKTAQSPYSDTREIAMNIYDIENRTVDELRQGYYYDPGKGYICLHCEFTSTSASAMESHLKEIHSKEEDSFFYHLLNADSVLGELSYPVKMVAYCLYKRMTDKEIGETLNMNPNTVRSHRRLLRKKYSECKVMLMLCERMNLGRQSDRARPPAPDERIPGLDADGNVIGFFGKDRVHDPKRPIPHASVLLLVAQRHEDGAMRFLICTKSSRMLTFAGKADAAFGEQLHKRWIDIEGGQCQQSDCAAIELHKPLPEEIFINAAKRELEEEVYIKAYPLDTAKPMYLYTDETGKEGTKLFPFGQNMETTRVYLVRLPDGIPQNRILVRDTWTDSVGGSITKRYPSEFVTFEELLGFVDSDDTALMDGALRVVERMKRDPTLKKRMFDMLENAEL